MRTLLMAALAVIAALQPVAARAQSGPLRLANGEPLMCVYFFPHWWDPWKASDDAVRHDLQRLRAMGFNTLLLDMEWSQAIDGNWRWVDRAHRLAAEAGMSIVPWLSPKTWSDVSPGDRERLAKRWFGVDFHYGVSQDGKRASPLVWDPCVYTAGVKYTLMYLDRPLGGSLLRLRWQGKERPVVSLSVESAWDGSFDAGTNAMFRSWAKRKYGTIAALNHAWGTRLAGFASIDPCDRSIFDYPGTVERRADHPTAVEDHVAFRSAVVNDVLKRIACAVRKKHPDVLFMAEVPYQYDAEHPDARAYRINYGSNPEACDYADIVLFRCTGPLSAPEIEALARHRRRTGQRFILTYRTYSDWDVAPDAPAFAQSVRLYADQAAALGDGFGFYSFNEMVDTHVAFSPAMPEAQQHGWTAERSERAIGLMAAMTKRYLERVGTAAAR
jgi:hypothetical protein